MKRLVSIIMVAVLGLIGSNVFAQNNCLNFHKNKCQSYASKGYIMSNDSRSAIMRKGQTSEFRITIYQGKDYRISVCADEANLGSTVHLRLIDYDTEELLYDNKDFNYVKDFEFTVVQTRTIKISIEIPEDQSTKASANTTGLISKSINQGCVGVLIEEMSTPKTGF
ncbi:MAG: hypothetical protein IK117_06075 [Bacteroidales bacterium]|nr:hypothetical protein [Bacteroidales bacterium]